MAPCTKCFDKGPPPGNKFCDQCGKKGATNANVPMSPKTACLYCGDKGPPPTSDESFCMTCSKPRQVYKFHVVYEAPHLTDKSIEMNASAVAVRTVRSQLISDYFDTPVRVSDGQHLKDEDLIKDGETVRVQIDPQKRTAAASLKKAIDSLKVLDIEQCVARAKDLKVDRDLTKYLHDDNLYETAEQKMKALRASMGAAAETLTQTNSIVLDKDCLMQALMRTGISDDQFHCLKEQIEVAMEDSRDKAKKEIEAKGYSLQEAESALNACGYNIEKAVNFLEEKRRKQEADEAERRKLPEGWTEREENGLTVYVWSEKGKEYKTTSRPAPGQGSPYLEQQKPKHKPRVVRKAQMMRCEVRLFHRDEGIVAKTYQEFVDYYTENKVANLADTRWNQATLPTDKVWLFDVLPKASAKDGTSEPEPPGPFPENLEPFAFKPCREINPSRSKVKDKLTLEINFRGSHSSLQPLEEIKMNLSWPSVITLPPESRDRLNISDDATWFCCVYPSFQAIERYPKLKDQLKEAKKVFLRSNSPTTSSDIEKDLEELGNAADICFLTVGGFVYLSKNQHDEWVIENMTAIIPHPDGRLRFGPVQEKSLSVFGEPPYAEDGDKLVIGSHTFHRVTVPALIEHGVTHYSWIRCNERLGNSEEEADAVCGHGGFAYINYVRQDTPRPPSPPLLPAKTIVPPPVVVCPACSWVYAQNSHQHCGNCGAPRPENPIPQVIPAHMASQPEPPMTEDELKQKPLGYLKRKAKSIGIPEDVVDEVDNDPVPKNAAVKMILEKQKANSANSTNPLGANPLGQMFQGVMNPRGYPA